LSRRKIPAASYRTTLEHEVEDLFEEPVHLEAPRDLSGQLEEKLVLDLLAHRLREEPCVPERDGELRPDLGEELDLLGSRDLAIRLHQHRDAQGLGAAAERQRQDATDLGPRAAAPFVGDIRGLGDFREVGGGVLGAGLAGDALPHLEAWTPAHDGRVPERPGIEHLGARIEHPQRDLGEAPRAEE
jgi:hypothetical protein